MMASGKPPSDIYKNATMVLATALISMTGAYFLATKNAVSKDELPAIIKLNNPYENDAKDIKNKLDDLRDRVIKLDVQQRQIGVDIAGIAAKAGVTAHPITDSGDSQQPKERNK